MALTNQHSREKDLERRSRNGAFVYSAVFFVIGIGTEFYRTSPADFYSILAIFVALGAIRLISYKFSDLLEQQHFLLREILLYFNALSPALLLGIVFSASLIMPRFEPLFLLVLLSVFGMLSGGIVNFSPRPDISVSYVAVLLLPPFVSLVMLTSERALEATLLFVYGIYMLLLSRRMNSEYSTLVEQQAELERINLQDSLTGIYNRRAFDQSFDDRWALQSRPSGKVTLMLIDIDHFKQINDQLGHSMGDLVLKQVANEIRKVCRRETDIVARIGGEEFAVLLTHKEQKTESELAEKIRLTISQMKFLQEQPERTVTVSIGVASICPSFENSPKTLFDLADKRLYRAKAFGRNRVVAD